VDNKEVLREVMKNPFYRAGRGHGVRFAQAVQADEVKVTDIGANAQTKLNKLGIKISRID
jgi:predicted Fe-Mo cluster-binding NifX family protein